jgi:hypothetical protein
VSGAATYLNLSAALANRCMGMSAAKYVAPEWFLRSRAALALLNQQMHVINKRENQMHCSQPGSIICSWQWSQSPSSSGCLHDGSLRGCPGTAQADWHKQRSIFPILYNGGCQYGAVQWTLHCVGIAAIACACSRPKPSWSPASATIRCNGCISGRSPGNSAQYDLIGQS